VSAPTAPLVLIVNDDLAIIHLLTLLLARHGYPSVYALAAEPALGMLHALRPQLMIIDLDMPGVNGQAVLEQLRATPAISGTPVLALSTQYPNDCVRRLADAAYEKPFALEAILGAVRRLCAVTPRHAQRDEGPQRIRALGASPTLEH
jgi:CheY-like chemotaxis protein